MTPRSIWLVTPTSSLLFLHFFYMFLHFFFVLFLGPAAQQALQHLCLLPQEAQQWLTGGGGASRLDGSRGLSYFSPQQHFTGHHGNRIPPPPFLPIKQTVVLFSNATDQTPPLGGGESRLPPPVIGRPGQRSAIVSYGNVLPSRVQERRRNKRPCIYGVLLPDF